jgi:hypothetical protein
MSETLELFAMTQAVSRRPVTAEARVRSWVSPRGVCGGQSGTGTGFSPSTSVSPVNFIPPVLYYMEKRKKNLSSSSQGCTISLKICGASVASATAPSTKTTNKWQTYRVYQTTGCYVESHFRGKR